MSQLSSPPGVAPVYVRLCQSFIHSPFVLTDRVPVKASE